jgi:hypothetical protein
MYLVGKKKYLYKKYKNKELSDLIYLKFLPLWLQNYKFQTKAILNLRHMLSRIYNNDIEIKLINLNYIFLDSYILTKAVVKRMRIMRINSKVYKHKLPIKVFFKGFYYAKSGGTYILINYLKKQKKILDMFHIKNIINKNKTIIRTGFFFKNILYSNKHINKYILYILKQKKISGVHMIARGRLTRRYTAARAIQ